MQLGSAEAINVPVMHQVFADGEFLVETRILKHDADPAPDLIRMQAYVIAEYGGVAGCSGK